MKGPRRKPDAPRPKPPPVAPAPRRESQASDELRGFLAVERRIRGKLRNAPKSNPLQED